MEGERVEITCERCGKTEMRAKSPKKPKWCLNCHKELNRIQNKERELRKKAEKEQNGS